MSDVDLNVKTLSARSIAKKHGISLASINQKIAKGVKVEKEHTKSSAIANQIARDHLGERPDYYEKLSKMEKSKVNEDAVGVGGVRGLGNVTGDPAGELDAATQYINTNAMAYEDMNGAILKMIRGMHDKHIKSLGFTGYDPTDKHATNRVVKEQTALADIDGSASIKPRALDVKEFWMPFLTKHHKHTAYLSKKKANKPDTIVDPGGTPGHVSPDNGLKEETKMDTKDIINEAIGNIIENNLSEMKENIVAVINEKAIEKLEERKKDIAATYFSE